MPRQRQCARFGQLAAALALLAALAVVDWRAPAAAQDGTPVPGAVVFPLSPDPADCRVAPRSIDELIALWYGAEGSPVAAAGAPVAEEAPSSVTIPVGPPADKATVAGVVATVREVFACFEAGDFLRATALFTDDLVRQFGPEPGTTEEDVRVFLATPEPETEGEASQILAITDVMVLADGRVGAFVVDSSAEEGATTAYVIFAREGDRWLVDEVIEFDFGEEGEAGEE